MFVSMFSLKDKLSFFVMLNFNVHTTILELLMPSKCGFAYMSWDMECL